MTQFNMEENSIVKKVIEKTIFYDLDYFVPQEDGTVKHFHSYRFLDNKPERKNSPEFTEEEEQQVVNCLCLLAKYF